MKNTKIMKKIFSYYDYIIGSIKLFMHEERIVKE